MVLSIEANFKRSTTLAHHSNLGKTALDAVNGILVPGSALPSERTLWGIGHSIKRHIENLGEYIDDNRDGFDAVSSGLAIIGLTAVLVASVVPELGPEEVLASELDVVSKGSRGWKAAVKALRNGGDRSVNIRVPDQRTARQLIEEARPGIPKIRSYNGSQDGFGFEYHLKNEAPTAPANDLRHIKWYDYRKGQGDRRGQGHVYFDDWW